MANKITITVEGDEYQDDEAYFAPHQSVFEHDTDTAPTWFQVVDTFKRALTAAGYLGVEKRLIVLEYGTEVRNGQIVKTEEASGE